jgi:hypothetical protein
MAEKAAITHRFLQRKMEEFQALEAEIDALRQEAASAAPASSKEHLPH